MGVDFIDIHFRLEKTFNIKIGKELIGEFESRGVRKFTVRDLVEFVKSRLPPTDPQDILSRDRPCIVCGYNLCGLPLSGRCPECGFVSNYEGLVEAGVHQVLIDALGIKPQQIRADATLVGDLGMT